MAHAAVKAFREFSVCATLVRVVTDCAEDIETVVAAERRVIGGFARRGLWPHEAVTLFVLENLAPLVGQLRQLHGLDEQEALQLPQRPMVNLYDLRRQRECFVFVNRQVMLAEGYWGDVLAVEGLLAHEHAHPVAECAALAIARGLKVVAEGPTEAAPLLARLGETLSTGALSELFANDACIANGFDAAMAHLDRVTVMRAAANLAQRPELCRRLAAATAAGTMTAGMESLLLRLADAQSTLIFALELAPFARAGHAARGKEIADILRRRILPSLDKAVGEMFFALNDLYLRPRSDWTSGELLPWCDEVLALLSAGLGEDGNAVTLRRAGEPT